jgi:hypothetical protein
MGRRHAMIGDKFFGPLVLTQIGMCGYLVDRHDGESMSAYSYHASAPIHLVDLTIRCHWAISLQDNSRSDGIWNRFLSATLSYDRRSLEHSRWLKEECLNTVAQCRTCHADSWIESFRI